jgi:T-complex protein 1 subunit theta
LSLKLEAESKKLTGLDQYSFSRYAKAFEVFPRILAENCGINANDFLAKMISANAGDVAKGLNILNGEVEPVSSLGIYDHRYTKEWAIRLASEAAITVLKVDQIIVAKPAGGPKMQQNKNWDDE